MLSILKMGVGYGLYLVLAIVSLQELMNGKLLLE